MNQRSVRQTESSEAREVELQVVSVFCSSEGEGAEAKETCVSSNETVDRAAAGRFIIRVDQVHAEPDPAQGLILTIPRLMPDPGAKSSTDGSLVATSSLDAPAWVRHEEIRLPIPLEHYESLFAGIRKRSLWAFLIVFAIGTALSAGVATRYTRPVRRLDAGIRRLSAGDLDVQVQAQGGDEIARLGRAFNEMTRSLRANRERGREMVRREKHSALGRLAAGVAHDIRNPLHSIGLTLQHLHETCRPEDDGRAAEFDRALDVIRGEIHRLDKLVGNFLSFARSEPRARAAVDLCDLLRETERLVRKEAEWREVRLELQLDESVMRVVADAEALRSSVLNLVLNSFEAMPQGGRLTLGLHNGGDEAVVEVSDTGVGIPAEDADRVFDFAFTTREGGTGLGLAMVYQCVVEDHGGRVDLKSALGRGTTVRLALPVVEAQQRELAV